MAKHGQRVYNSLQNYIRINNTHKEHSNIEQKTRFPSHFYEVCWAMKSQWHCFLWVSGFLWPIPFCIVFSLFLLAFPMIILPQIPLFARELYSSFFESDPLFWSFCRFRNDFLTLTNDQIMNVSQFHPWICMHYYRYYWRIANI